MQEARSGAGIPAVPPDGHRAPTGLIFPEDVSDAESAASFLFTDRVPESQALADSLSTHIRRVREDRVTGVGEPNVLTFYGMGGVGKSQLSQRLEAWLTGGLPGDSEWGAPPPLAGPVLTVRWDLNDTRGNLDVAALMIGLRAGLTRSGRSWPAFDLAFAAYLSSVRPGETMTLGGGVAQTDSLLSVLSGLAADFGAASTVTSLSTAVIRRVVDVAVTRHREHRELAAFPGLGDLLERCRAIPNGNDSPSVAADLVWLLSQSFAAIPARERPPLVVFIDAFERVQDHDASRAEAILNHLVGRLPYALFVITGRSQVDWHDPRRIGLRVAGAKRWPSLVPGRTQEPRQHFLGRLSDEDAASLFRKRRAQAGWPMDDSLIPELVAKTAGWPLHIDAVCRVADNLTDDGADELTASDLVRSLPDLIRRLFEDLTDEQARAFHAACLLPYFDRALAAAVGNVSEAAVDGCIRRAIVELHSSELYPYRVHDVIRRLVRDAGTEVKGGWTANDWRAAAQRGLAEAKRRHDEATLARDDRATMEAIALALTIGVTEAVHADWLADAVRFGPTVRGLAPLLPTVPQQAATTDAVALIQLIGALNAPKDPASPLRLREIFEGPTAISEQGGRWRAYRLRQLYRYEESLDQFRELLERFPDQHRLYHRQYSITLRMMRRFRDATDYGAAHGLEGKPGPYLRLHGHDTDDLAERLAEARGRQSTRYAFEGITGAVTEEARFRPVSREGVLRMRERAINLSDPVREADSWIIETYQHLHDEARFEDAVANVVRLGRVQSLLPRASIARLYGLRALVTGSSHDAERAWAEASATGAFRATGWIFTEFVMERIGLPLPPVPTQWLEPVEDVRARWYAVIDGIIERSRHGQIMVPEADLAGVDY